jgi:hypothetical protein
VAKQIAKSSVDSTSPKAKAVHFTGSRMFQGSKTSTTAAHPVSGNHPPQPHRSPQWNETPSSFAGLHSENAATTSESSFETNGFSSKEQVTEEKIPPSESFSVAEQSQFFEEEAFDDGDDKPEREILIEEIPNDDFDEDADHPTEEQVHPRQPENDALIQDEGSHVEPEHPTETSPATYSGHPCGEVPIPQDADRNRKSLPPPPPPPILSPITPRLSNTTTTNSIGETKPSTPQQRKRNSKKKKRIGLGSDLESDWSSDAVSAVSSSVNLAIDKLKSLAQPYYYQHDHRGRALVTTNTTAEEEEPPEVLNTSAEESADERPPSSTNNSSTSQSVDCNSSSSEPEANRLDMKALEMELRAKEESTKITRTDADAKDCATDPERNSVEATHILTTQTSVTEKNIQTQAKSKEVQSSKNEVSDPRRNLSLNTIGAPMMKQLEAASRKGIYALHGIAVRDGTNSSKPSRAITPIMRMRSKAGDLLAAEMEENASPARRSHASSNLDEEDYFALKQKRWKEKMKLVEEEREKERNILHGELQSRNRRRKKRGKRSKHSRRRANDDERSFLSNKSANTFAGFGECKNEISALIGKILRTQCGSLDDAFVDEDESTDDSDSESGDDETATEDLVSADADLTTSAASTANKYNTKNYAKEKMKPEVQVASATTVDSEKSVAKETLDSTSSNRKNKQNNSSDTKRTPKEKNDLDMKDKNFIRQFIAGATRTGTVLMLHEKNEGKNSLKRPTKHIFFIQPGTLAKCGRYVGPSLVWKAMDSNLIGEVDLFDVSALDKASARQLAEYPLAMPGRSLFIRTNQGVEYVFEAKTEEQAVRFIHGMRWVIARLTFNLIIGNANVSCELLDVEGSNEEDDDDAEKLPQTPIEEAQWTIAMNEVTSHLVDKASTT